MSNIQNITKTTKVETSSTGNIDLKQFGIEQNPSASPITGNEDYSKYFQTTSQTTSEPIDLKQFGIEQNASASPITGNEDYSKYFQSYDSTQNAASNYNEYGENKVTTTKVVKSYVAPTQSTQSYSYNYSYQMPTTTKMTITKAKYSRGS